jgi:peptide-methionine (S)-S-oxide reductase
MSAVYYEGDEQLAAIRRTMAKHVAQPELVRTEIAPLTTFWIAEDYHQKYRLRHSALADELHTIYPDEADFVASTAAARINGWLDGYGDPQQLEREITRLGLSDAGQQLLRRSVR